MRAHLYFVRHGETVANRDGIRQGVSADYPLTDRGHDQAARAGTALQGVQWHAVYSSDLPRAVKVCFISISSVLLITRPATSCADL